MHELSALVPGSEVVVVEQAAHSAYFEKPAEFNRHVLGFLSRRVRSLDGVTSALRRRAEGGHEPQVLWPGRRVDITHPSPLSAD